jgi:hypothetical protein
MKSTYKAFFDIIFNDKNWISKSSIKQQLFISYLISNGAKYKAFFDIIFNELINYSQRFLAAVKMYHWLDG